MTAPLKALTEDEINEIEARYNAAARGPAFVPSEIVRVADTVPRLVADLRRIRNEMICPQHAGLIEKFVASVRLCSDLTTRCEKLGEAIDAVKERRHRGAAYAALRHAKANVEVVLAAQTELKRAARNEDLALKALEAKPVPMCRPDPSPAAAKTDPVGDIFPAGEPKEPKP